MNNQNAIHVAIASTIAAVLEAHGIAQRDLPDAIAAVTARMIEAAETGSTPRSTRAWTKLAQRTAARYAAEEMGRAPVAVTPRLAAHAYVERDGDAENAEAVEGVLWALLDNPASPERTRTQIALLGAMLEQGEMPELGREILAGLGDKKKVPAIARALGISPEEVRGRLRAMRTRFFRRLAAVEEVTTEVLDAVDEGGGGLGDDELADEKEGR
jgi:hypothetical protein